MGFNFSIFEHPHGVGVGVGVGAGVGVAVGVAVDDGNPADCSGSFL